jgi:hypothetical protein
MSLMKYLSVTDNARDDVLLHVSASTERQERGNKTGLIKKRKSNSKTHTYLGIPFLYCY